MLQHFALVAGLHLLPQLHDHHPVGDVGHHTKIMGDEQHAGPVFLLQFSDQLEDFSLSGHIQRGGRLVANQQ